MAKLEIKSTAKKTVREFAKDVVLNNVPDNCQVYFFVFGISDIKQEIVEDLKKIRGRLWEKFVCRFLEYG